jgi:hypothetical protein
MRSPVGSGRVLAFALLLPLLVLATAPASTAQTFWAPDASISDGDVNETYTALNHQRFAAVDDSNNLYITFYDNRHKSGADNNFEIFFRRFTYNFGSPSVTRVTDAYNPSQYPAIATLNWGRGDSATVNDSGRVYLAWQDSRHFSVPLAGDPKSFVIYFRTYQSRGGAGFGPEFQVSPYDSVDAAKTPSIAVDPSHRAWIFWQKTTSGSAPDIWYAVYDAVTRTMGAATPFTSYDGFSSVTPSVAATRSGEIHVVWTDNRTGRNQIWWNTWSGGGWSGESQLVVSSGSASAPSLTADYAGRLHLVWQDNRTGNNEIWYKEYIPGTGWDVDTQVTLQTASQTQPSLDADPMSNLYLVWTDARNGSSNPDIYYRERKEGVWGGDLQLVGNNTDNNSNQIQWRPGITHDGVGTTFVAWSDERLPASGGQNREVFYKAGYYNATSVAEAPRPAASRLLDAYPNPFNPQAVIRFDLRRDGAVTLRAYDVQGRLVRTLVDTYLASGPREVRWDGRDDAGRGLPSGTYFLRLQFPGGFQSRTVTLVK